MNNNINNINNINQETKGRKPHNIVISNRRQMTVSGVIRVENFNESTIVVITETGLMTIDGTNLHISKLSLETGDMFIDGEIAGLFYSDDSYENGKKSPKLLSKLFK